MSGLFKNSVSEKLPQKKLVNMNRVFFVTMFVLLSVLVFAREVPATHQGIANASPGDHIIRSNGVKITLRQSDIDYARRQLGLITKQNIPSSTDSGSGNNRENISFIDRIGRDRIPVIIVIVISCVVHIILTFCVLKMKGGYAACFYFFLAPLALLFLLLIMKFLAISILGENGLIR